MTRKVLVLGASSEIGHAICRRWAAGGDEFLLVGRDGNALARVARDLSARGAGSALTAEQDLREPSTKLARQWCGQLGGVDLILISYGVMGVQKDLSETPELLSQQLKTNLTSTALWMRAGQKLLSKTGGGQMVVLGSVAGDRARVTNYWYGSTKAALEFIARGMQLETAQTGVQVVLVKPGMTDTKMTEGLDKSGPMWATAETVALAVDRAVRRGHRTCYAPGRWRWIMLIIRSIPFQIFKRLKF